MTRAPQSQLMMSATVRVRDAEGKLVTCRALLDTCATAHFITERLAIKLKLPRHTCSISIDAIDGMHTASKGLVEATIFSLHHQFKKELSFLVVPKIADLVPQEVFPLESVRIPTNLKLADPQFYLPSSIDLLIGSGATLSLLSVGQINLSNDNCDLILQKTQLGWVIVGGVVSRERKGKVSCNLTDLSQQLEKFWLVEEIAAKPQKTAMEIECEQHYIKHTQRNPSGKYIVRLPFRSDSQKLGESKTIALRRFHALLRRLNGDPKLKIEYERVMREYIDLGHMTLTSDSSDGYYLPHHAVMKSSSVTTKVRVVFDASAKSSNGNSLNDNLLVGPTIQDKLFEHLLKFRVHKYVLTADIEKMYRQVWIHPHDRSYQRIFWRHNGEIRTFELNTVTFGVASAPFLAIRTLHKLADDEAASFPMGAEVLKRDLYVDDLLTGADADERVLQIKGEVIEILRRGGFHIRQWASNAPRFIRELDRRSNPLKSLDASDNVLKTLGISWDPKRDKLLYTAQPIAVNARITKRHILSEIAKIFDPLGLLGPIILAAKVIMQECWKTKIAWDESVPHELHTKWKSFACQLPCINQLSINRRLLIETAINIEIHGFCDASERGYGACIYIRSSDGNGKTLVQLYCAKSRVAPVKPMTIPRLELCAALTLARLYREANIPCIQTKRVIFWSDSTIVLHWLKKEPINLKVFEAHRVSEIQDVCRNIEWRHVKTNCNPADALSRGQLPQEFLDNDLWFHGPVWLGQPEHAWPESIIPPAQELPGLKNVTCLVTTSEPSDIFSRFSSYSRLIRVIAYCLRFIRTNEYRGELSIQEIAQAETRVLKLIQETQFSDEIKRISSSGGVRNGRLASLNPIVNDDGLLRVGGRLKNARMPFSQKHPVLLPKHHLVTDLIIREMHERNYHAGVQSTLYAIRQRFWLFDGKNQIRRIVRHCVRCVRFKAVPVEYQMGNLPLSRIESAFPFYHTGMDFFGPMFVKEKKHRNRGRIKVYGCVFICMTSKAVHIEIVTELSTEAFLAAFRRFIARRALPAHVYSDNGRNFVGASNELRELYILTNSSEFRKSVHELATDKAITWHFNPPLSPHFGGMWEAAVKSFKHHLKRIVGDSLFTYEELNTLSIEIEAILNSRPLCPISSDPNDPLALSPAHLLVGRPFNSLPEHDLLSVPESHLSSWRLINKARQDFWKRWHVEYLNELQKRQKWAKPGKPLEIDTIVLIIDQNQPPMRWQLGRVVGLHHGKDGVARVATIKTVNGTYKRNMKLLCPLPTE